MCTPWTLTRFVRWRVRDLASCFLACRFSLAEEEPETHSSSLPQLPIRNIVFETKDETSTDKKSCNKRLLRKSSRCNKDRKLNHQSPKVSTRNTASVENGSDNNSSWARFSDEEYIVFCFREDGAFDVVKDSSNNNNNNNSKVEEEPKESSRSSRPVSRKLHFAEDAERDKQSNDEGRSNEGGNEEEIIAVKDQGNGERSSTCLGVELASNSLRRKDHPVEETETPTSFKGRKVSIESSDSNQSDGSTGSFAFPVLGWEWIGSPVQMPKSDDIMINPRKKPLSLHFQCFSL